MITSGQGVRIGEIGGHEIRLDVLLFGFLAFYLFYVGMEAQRAVAFLVAAFLSILVHELGHAATIRRLLGEHTLVVIGLGGYTLSSGRARPGQQILISLAGPTAGLVLGAAAWGISVALVADRGRLPWEFASGGSIWLMLLSDLVWLNLALSVLNLLPAVPLDGGRALRAMLVFGGMKPFRSRRLTRRLGILVAGAAAWFGFTRGFPILGILMLWILFANVEEAFAEGL